MKRSILSLVVICFLVTLVSADTEIYPVDTLVNLQFTCTLNDAIPSGSATFNLSIYYSNGTALVENDDANSLGSGSFYYPITFTSQGLYKVKMFCTDGTYSYSSEGFYKITYNGEEISTEQTYVYILGLIFLVLVILGTVFIINSLPSKDSMDVDGNIVQINWLKYLRPVLWIFTWGVGLAIVFIISNLGIAYLSNEMIGKLFFVIYQFMFYVVIIGVPVYFIWIFVKIFQDKEMQKLINRGVDIKGTP